MNLEQILKWIRKNLQTIKSTIIYTQFELWCKSGKDEDLDILIEYIQIYKKDNIKEEKEDQNNGKRIKRLPERMFV